VSSLQRAPDSLDLEPQAHPHAPAVDFVPKEVAPPAEPGKPTRAPLAVERWNADAGNGTLAGPIVLGHQLLLATLPAEVRSYSLQRGNPIWKAELGSAVAGQPRAAGDLVVAATQGPKGKLYAIRSADGTKKWEAAVGDIVASPTVFGEVAAVTELTGGVSAWRVSDGSESWRTAFNDQFLGSGTAWGGFVYLPGVSGTIYRLEAARGARMGKLQLDGRIRADLLLVDSASDPLLIAPVVDGSLAAFTPDLELIWRAEVPGPLLAPPTAAGELLVAFTGSGRAIALELSNQQARWEKEFPSPFRAPAAYDPESGLLGAADIAGTLWFIDGTTGEVRDRVQLNGPVRGTPLFTSEGLAVATERGRLSLYRLP